MPTPKDDERLVKTLRRAYGGHIDSFRKVLRELRPDDPLDHYLVGGSIVDVIADGVLLLKRHGYLRDLTTWRRLAAEVSLYEDELLEHATVWGHVVAVTPPPEPGRLPKVPYKDLASFTRSDAAIFFGRREKIQEILLALKNSESPFVLVYGPTGVGKSSILQAGVLPRTGPALHPVYVQHTASTTLLDSARRGLAGEGLLRAAWAAREDKLRVPVVLILDQVESIYTTGKGEESGDAQLAELLAALLDGPDDIILRGKLVLGFRKEWFAEVRRPFKERQLSRVSVEIPRLDADNIRDAILGPSQKLADHFKLSFDAKVVDQITVDLLRDTQSPIAPTLQVLLTQLWHGTEEDAAGLRHITVKQYDELGRKDERFKLHIQQRLRGLAEKPALKGSADSGLALDLLYECTTPARTARAIAQIELEHRYGVEIRELITACIEARLLRREGKDESKPTDVSLMHDTIGPIVWTLFRESTLPGQKARRLLERLVEGQKDTGAVPRIDRTDLAVLEQGRLGMRKLEKAEETIIAENKQRLDAELVRERDAQARERQSAKDLAKAAAQRLWYLRAVGLLAVLTTSAAAVSFWYYQKAEENLEFANDQTKKANDQADVAKVKTAEAEAEKTNAVRSAANARDKQRWVAMLHPAVGGNPEEPGVGGDPTMIAVLLREVELPEELPGWATEVFRVLQRPIARAVFRHNSQGASFSSPDGRFIFAINNGSWWLWRAEDGTMHKIAEHDRRTRRHAFSADGSMAALAWDVPDGKPELPPELWRTDGTGPPLILPGDESTVVHITFSPDGLHVATTSSGGTTYVTPLDAPSYHQIFDGFPEVAPGADFSPAGDKLVKLVESSTRIWNLDDGPMDWQSVPERVSQFSANGRYLFGDRFPGVIAYSVDRGSIKTLGSRLHCTSPDNRRLLVEDGDELRIVSTDDLTTLSKIERPDMDRSYEAVFNMAGDTVVIGDQNGEVTLWSVAHGRKVLKESVVLPDQTRGLERASFAIRKLGFSPDGRHVSVFSMSGAAAVLRADGNGRSVDIGLKEDEGVLDVVFSPESDRVMVLTDSRSRLMWMDGVSTDTEFNGHLGMTYGGGFSGTGGRMWTLDHEMTRGWSVEPTVPLVAPKKYKNIRLTSNLERTVTVEEDGTTKLWLRGHRNPETLRGPSDVLGTLAFSSDGARVIMDSEGFSAVIRDLVGGSPDVVLRGHTGRVRAAAFSADGSRVITGSEDGTTRLWQLDGRDVETLQHTDNVLAVAFTADGDRVVTGSADGTVRVWQADGTRSVTVLQYEQGAAVSVAFSPVGDRVLAITKEIVEQENAERRSLSKVWVRAASGSDDRTPLLTGELAEPVDALFSPDGRRLVVIAGKQVHVWHEDKTQAQVLDAAEGIYPFSSVYARDGSRVVVLGSRGHAEILPICSPQECTEALWRATSYCLSAADRHARLGEGEKEATENAEACKTTVDGLMAQGAYH